MMKIRECIEVHELECGTREFIFSEIIKLGSNPVSEVEMHAYDIVTTSVIGTKEASWLWITLKINKI